MSKPLQIRANYKPVQAQLAAPASTAKSLGLDLKAQATASLQPKQPLQPKQREASVSDRVFNDTPLGRINPKETLGKLPTVLKGRAAKLPTSDAAPPLGKAQVGWDLTCRQQSSTALDQRMKDGAGLGRGDSLGLLDPARKATKDELLAKPNGSAPVARVGAVQQRDQYSIQGDSFLMTGSGGRKYVPDQASRQQKEDETLEGAGDLAASYGGFVVGLVSPNAATVIGMADMVRTGNRDFSKSRDEIDGKTVFDAAVGFSGNVAAVAGGLGVAGNAVPAVSAFTTGYAIGSALDKTTNGALSDAGAVAIEVVVDAGSAVAGAAKRAGAYVGQKVGNAWDWVTGGYLAEDGGPINPQTLQKINVLQGVVNPNKPLSPDPDPRNADPLTNPQRGDAAGSVRPANPDIGLFGAVNQGVVCPGPEQFKSLVNPNQIDFLTAGFQQRTDALINPSRQEDGSSGGPVLQALGRAVFGQDGFTSISTDGLSEHKLNDVLLRGGTGATGTRSISTDGLSERKVSDFVLNQGAASNGFQAISTDGLSERLVVGFTLGQVPSAAQGFQAISTDGLSERSGAGQVFTAAVQGSVSADPFAATAPTSPVF